MITHDFASGQIAGANIVERAGLELMRLSTRILKPIEFTGFSWAARIIRTALPSRASVRMVLAPDCVFEYPYGDGYWGVMLNNSQCYSPEVEPYLRSFADIDYVFIDCGANYGYMSALVSSSEFGSKPCIAIEAGAENFAWTKRNSEINGNRFECRHNAIFSTSGEIVRLGGVKHEARTIAGQEENTGGEEVETLALRDLAPWIESRGNLPVVLKLDIEGVEIDALKGAGPVIEGDCLINYEEHGADKTHEVSHYLKDVLGLRLFIGDEHRLKMREITSYEQLDALKVNPRRGYDLFATRSPFWLDRFEQLMQAA